MTTFLPKSARVSARPQQRANLQERNEIRCDTERIRHVHSIGSGDRVIPWHETTRGFDRLGALQIAERDSAPRELDLDKLPAMRKGKRAQHQRVDHRKHRTISPGAQCQHQYYRDGKAWLRLEDPETLTHRLKTLATTEVLTSERTPLNAGKAVALRLASVLLMVVRFPLRRRPRTRRYTRCVANTNHLLVNILQFQFKQLPPDDSLPINPRAARAGQLLALDIQAIQACLFFSQPISDTIRCGLRSLVANRA
jgi:hypothetical protein